MDRSSVGRRDWLKTAGTVAAGAALSAGCGRFAPRRTLAKVQVAPERVIRTVVGLRPFRPSGFLVKSEALDKKTVIHNYGHGGGGVTMSWGTAHLAMEEALKTGQTSCAVIGCGAVGLATARLLQKRGFAVTIYAKDLPPNTTSNVACAQWSPAESADPNQRTPEFVDRFIRAARLSYRYFQDYIGDYYGVRWIRNYALSEDPPEDRGMRNTIQDLFPEFSQIDRKEHPFPYAYCQRYWTMLIEPPVYLNAVLRDFLLGGGTLVVREFGDREAILKLPEPVVINCTGIGAKALFNDEELMPIKGQLTVLLPQPEIDYITITSDLYMMPRKDGILLGGTHERGEWSLEPNASEMKRVMDGHIEFFSQMA